MYVDLQEPQPISVNIKRKNVPNELHDRLYRLHSASTEVLEVFNPDLIIIEDTFANGKSGYSAIVVKEAIGVLKVASLLHNPLTEVKMISPFDVKFYVLGKQTGKKSEVAQALEDRGFELPCSTEEIERRKLDHLTDSLAIVISYFVKNYDKVIIRNQRGVNIGCLKPKTKAEMKKVNNPSLK